MKLYEKNGEDVKANLHWGQKLAIESKKRYIALIAGTQGGKALDIETEIPTIDGWKKLKELKVGDKIFDENGDVQVITFVSGIFTNQAYEITFDDNSKIIANEDHRWKVQTLKQRKNQKRRVPNPNESYQKRPQCKRSEDYKIITTKELLNDYKETGIKNKIRSNYSIDICKPVQYPDRELEIQPYTLGAWIGDGISANAGIVIADKEIIFHIEKEGYKLLSGQECNSGKALRYTISNGLQVKLRKAGLLRNKHIPDIYLISSVEQRFQLLRGLMDTNGYCGVDGTCEFCTKKEKLAKDVLELLMSIGVKARLKYGIAKLNGKSFGIKYRVCFTTNKKVFNITRKQERIKLQIRDDCNRRFIRDIKKVQGIKSKCIAVSGNNKLYLAGKDYIITHNTEFAPYWMYLEMKKRGGGEYIAASPNYPLQSLKLEPAYEHFFIKVFKFGEYIPSKKQMLLYRKDFRGDNECKLYFGSADRPESLESATAKGVHIDEVGQKAFKLEAFEALDRRGGTTNARILMTTTLYNFGWFKTEIYDKWLKGNKDIDVIQFPSFWNPVFPYREYMKKQNELPLWKFKMFYRGEFAKPAGMVFDCFESTEHIVKDFAIPLNWPRYIGLDFGGVNTVALWIAEEKINEQVSRYYVYRRYHEGNRTGKEHGEAIKKITGNEWLIGAIGGAKSENQWRLEFRDGGLIVIPDLIGDVEIGVSKIYSLFKEKRLFIFESVKNLIDEIGNYSRKLDSNNQPTDEIEDKSSYHDIDALRYFAGYITRPKATIGVASVNRG